MGYKSAAAEPDFSITKTDSATDDEMESFHIHRRCKIIYELEGSSRYFIEDTTCFVPAGSVVLIGDGQLHKVSSVNGSPSRRIVLSFRADFLAELQCAFPEIDFLSFLSQRETHLLNFLSIRQQNRIHSLLQQLLDWDSADSHDAEIIRKMLLTTLLLLLKHLAREQLSKVGGPAAAVNPVVDQIQQFISRHYAEKLSLTGIAHQFYISPYYLSRLFKRTIGLSLVEYVNGVRIKAAQHLLEESTCSISEIAESTGFATAAHFRRVFKAASGYSPQQYRLYYHQIDPAEEE